MDYFRPISRCLTPVLATVSAVALMGATANVMRLRGERWLAPGASVAALTVAPHECLAPSKGEAEARLIGIGRAAFAAPLLLGGQAARTQLSCASCHPSGRRNANFFLVGLSDSSGTADVTSSIMSSHRSNGVFDPKPIPDLTDAGKVSRDPSSPELALFVHGLITQEFDGADPPPIVFKGLLAYLRAVRACQSDAVEPITVDAAVSDVAAAMHAASDSLQLGDISSARLMIGAARMRLGDIYERYALPSLRAEQTAIKAIDQKLLTLQQALDQNENIASPLAVWQFPPRLSQRLHNNAPRSFYNAATLALEHTG